MLPSPDTHIKHLITHLALSLLQCEVKLEKAEKCDKSMFVAPEDIHTQWAVQKAVGNVLWAFCRCMYWVLCRSRRSIGQTEGKLVWSINQSIKIDVKKTTTDYKDHFICFHQWGFSGFSPGATSRHSPHWTHHGCWVPLEPSRWMLLCVDQTMRTSQHKTGHLDQSRRHWWLRRTNKYQV